MKTKLKYFINIILFVLLIWSFYLNGEFVFGADYKIFPSINYVILMIILIISIVLYNIKHNVIIDIIYISIISILIIVMSIDTINVKKSLNQELSMRKINFLNENENI